MIFFDEERPGSVRLRLFNLRLIFVHGWDAVRGKQKSQAELALLGMSEAPSLLAVCVRESFSCPPGPSAVLSRCPLEPSTPVRKSWLVFETLSAPVLVSIVS